MKKQNWVVMKFGGTSVSTVARWDTIGDQCDSVCQREISHLLCALRLSGVSNLLEQVIATAPLGQHASYLQDIKQKHENLAEAMGIPFDPVCGPLFGDLERVVTGCAMVGEVSVKQRARIMSAGELLSTTMGAAYLQQTRRVVWLDAREHMVSEEVSRRSMLQNTLEAYVRPDTDAQLRHRLGALETDIVITQGFIGQNKKGDTVLLGRGGSDTSASQFAVKLDAIRCEIWTDVRVCLPRIQEPFRMLDYCESSPMKKPKKSHLLAQRYFIHGAYNPFAKQESRSVFDVRLRQRCQTPELIAQRRRLAHRSRLCLR